MTWIIQFTDLRSCHSSTGLLLEVHIVQSFLSLLVSGSYHKPSSNWSWKTYTLFLSVSIPSLRLKKYSPTFGINGWITILNHNEISIVGKLVNLPNRSRKFRLLDIRSLSYFHPHWIQGRPAALLILASYINRC